MVAVRAAEGLAAARAAEATEAPRVVEATEAARGAADWVVARAVEAMEVATVVAVRAVATEAVVAGDKYQQLMAEGGRFASVEDWRRAAESYFDASRLRRDEPVACLNLGAAFNALGHEAEAALCYLEAQKRAPAGSECWAHAAATAFNLLRLKECDCATPWPSRGGGTTKGSRRCRRALWGRLRTLRERTACWLSC